MAMQARTQEFTSRLVFTAMARAEMFLLMWVKPQPAMWPLWTVWFKLTRPVWHRYNQYWPPRPRGR